MNTQLFIEKWKSWALPEIPIEKYRLYLLITACTCFFICVFSWYPGHIAADTMHQYIQAIGAAPISDWHPPIFVWFWRLEIEIFHTANLLNATWIFLNVLGLFLFLRFRPCNLSLLLFGLIFGFPSFFGINGYLYKDIPLAWLLLIVAALLFALKRENKYYWGWKLLISILLIICCLIRINAAFIVVPLLISTWWEWRFDFKHLIICLILVVLALPAAAWINHNLLQASEDHAEASLEIFDLAGISFYNKYKKYDFYDEKNPERHREIFDDWDHSPLNERLLTCYTPKKWDTFGEWVLPNFPTETLGWNKWGNAWNANVFSSDFKAKAHNCFALGYSLRKLPPENLFKMWIEAIKSHPLSYFKHRFAFFYENYYFVHMDEVAPEDVEIPSSNGYFSEVEADAKYGTPSHRTFIGHFYRNLGKHHLSLWTNYGFFWLLSAFALFIVSFNIENRINRFVNLCSFSAFCYLSAYFFIGIGSESRYMLPAIALMIAACLSWYVSGEKIGTQFSRKIACAIWIVFMFWSCIL